MSTAAALLSFHQYERVLLPATPLNSSADEQVAEKKRKAAAAAEQAKQPAANGSAEKK